MNTFPLITPSVSVELKEICPRKVIFDSLVESGVSVDGFSAINDLV